MDRVRTTAWALTLAGLIPFVGCAALIAFDPGGGRVWIEPLAAYGAVILSFLGGALWGRELAGDRPDAGRLILSNAPAVAAWLTFLPGVGDAVQLGVLAAGLVIIWVWDLGGMPGWYRALRTVATIGAVACLAASALVIG
jgi:hypothetical protein